MTDQPARQEAPKKNKPAPRIDIFKAWCKGCGICAAFCPRKALAMDEAGFPFVKDPSLCGRCGLCELRCPDFAITIEEKREEDEPGQRPAASPGSAPDKRPGKSRAGKIPKGGV